jgi:hypothetical protein
MPGQQRKASANTKAILLQNAARTPDPLVVAREHGQALAEPAPQKPLRTCGTPQQARAPPPNDYDPMNVLAFSIPMFCRLHGLSVSMFHKMRTTGLGPDVFRVGRRTLISASAAQRWIEQREEAARQQGAARQPGAAETSTSP